MTLPNAQVLYDVIDATWPAASLRRVGPWLIREGQGGGSRVSAATAVQDATTDDLAAAEQAMRDLGQSPLFQIRAGDDVLDSMLENAGYGIMDPVVMYAAPACAIGIKRPPPVTSFEVWPPLQAQADVWAAGGIDAGRLAVMDRAPTPKTTLLGRMNDRPAGTAFIGMAHGCAMIHALEVAPPARRKGHARHLTQAAAFWAQAQGAAHITLVTTQANQGANALYTSLGFTVVGHYHYRIKKD